MAGNLKQRLIKAGRDFNYAEGVKILNGTGTAIPANSLVAMSGYSGPFVKVTLAETGAAAANTQGRNGRLLIAKHEIPANGYGVALPWKLVTGTLDTSSKNVGDLVYLSTATPGGVTLAVSGTAALIRVVGTVVHSDDTTGTGTGQPGAYMFCGDMDTGIKS